MNIFKLLLSTLSLTGLTLCLAGCGGDSAVGQVTGTVHMDGQPLADAMITFYPQNENVGMKRGGASMGRTDAEGKYELIYSRSTKGAEIGEHLVYIETGEEGDGYGGGKPETVPKRYNVDSELKVTVESGSNEIDFLDLTSEGDKRDVRGVDQ